METTFFLAFVITVISTIIGYVIGVKHTLWRFKQERHRKYEEWCKKTNYPSTETKG